MSRPALAATRAVAVLNFLAANPTEGFTLSDVSTRLGINLASTHALLGVLADAGYVVRNPRRRTFSLGPAVVALGSGALECHPAIDLARDAARELAREVGVEVAVTAVAGDQIVFLARAGEHSARSVPVHVGQHVPFVPPIGSVFVAWGGAEPWLARGRDREQLVDVLDAVRRRGYSIALEADARADLGRALDALAGLPGDDQLRATVDGLLGELGRREYQLRDLDAARDYDVSMIAAPVFGTDGEVVLALTLLGFGEGLRGAEVAAYGERVRDAGLVVTKQSRGRVPSKGAENPRRRP